MAGGASKVDLTLTSFIVATRTRLVGIAGRLGCTGARANAMPPLGAVRADG